jgi:hypothetical protein
MKYILIFVLIAGCHGPFWGRGRRRDDPRRRGHHHLVDKEYCNRFEGQQRLDCQDKQTIWVEHKEPDEMSTL